MDTNYHYNFYTDWDELEVGKIYKYEEGAFFQVHVVILEKVVEEDYVRLKVKVTKNFKGSKQGTIINLGKTKNEKLQYLIKGKFKDINSFFDYV